MPCWGPALGRTGHLHWTGHWPSVHSQANALFEVEAAPLWLLCHFPIWLHSDPESLAASGSVSTWWRQLCLSVFFFFFFSFNQLESLFTHPLFFLLSKVLPGLWAWQETLSLPPDGQWGLQSLRSMTALSDLAWVQPHHLLSLRWHRVAWPSPPHVLVGTPHPLVEPWTQDHSRQ